MIVVILVSGLLAARVGLGIAGVIFSGHCIQSCCNRYLLKPSVSDPIHDGWCLFFRLLRSLGVVIGWFKEGGRSAMVRVMLLMVILPWRS